MYETQVMTHELADRKGSATLLSAGQLVTKGADGLYRLVTQSPETYSRAGEMLISVRKVAKEIKTYFDPIVTKANAVHKEATGQRTRALEPTTAADAILSEAISDYDAEQDRKNKKEAAEREALGKVAEEADRVERAANAEAAGRHHEAARIMSTAQDPRKFAPPPAQPTAPTPKVKGLIMRDHWTVEVRDLKMLVLAVAADKAPLTTIMPDEKALRKLAEITKVEGEFLGVPGTLAKNEKKPARTAGRGY
jgi:hypothetical protein